MKNVDRLKASAPTSVSIIDSIRLKGTWTMWAVEIRNRLSQPWINIDPAAVFSLVFTSQYSTSHLRPYRWAYLQ